MEYKNIVDWSDWLRENSAQYFLTNKRSYSWKGVAGAHNPKLELVDQLEGFYRKLTPHEQTNFRKGLTHCLSTLEQIPSNTPVFIFLINFANAVTCNELIESSFLKK